MSLCRGGSFWDLIKYRYSMLSIAGRCAFPDVVVILLSYAFTWRKSFPFPLTNVDHRGGGLPPQLRPPDPPRLETREHSDHGDGPHHAFRLRHHHNARQRPDEAAQHDVWHDPLSRPRSTLAVPLRPSRCKEETSRRRSTSGPSAASPIFSTRAAFSSRARTSLLLPSSSRRLNVIDSIEHFCVDMLDFPDYIPADATVDLSSASHAGPDQAHAAVRPTEANHHARDQGGLCERATARATRSSKASTSPRCRRSDRRTCRRSCRCR